MPKRSVNILLVESEPSLAEMIEECLLEVMQVQINRVSCAGEALREELNHRHDLVITELSLPDADGLELVRRIQVSNKCPTILLADSPTPEDLIDAMRLGIRGVAPHPIDTVDLVRTIRGVLRTELRQRRQRTRYRRLRLLTGRILRERRDLRERIDLICKDVVQAYRRLAQDVASSGILERTTASSSSTTLAPNPTAKDA